MPLRDIIAQARSYRRFQENTTVDMNMLVDIVDATRLVPSSANLQQMRYGISTSREVNARIFPHLKWAMMLKDWQGPAAGERPAAYIVIAGDAVNPAFHKADMAIAAQTINLLLTEAGLTACMLGAINAKAIHQIMGFAESLEVLLVIAVGYKLEKVVVDPLPPGGNTAYWREPDGTHHVPKRGLAEVLVQRFE